MSWGQQPMVRICRGQVETAQQSHREQHQGLGGKDLAAAIREEGRNFLEADVVHRAEDDGGPESGGRPGAAPLLHRPLHVHGGQPRLPPRGLLLRVVAAGGAGPARQSADPAADGHGPRHPGRAAELRRGHPGLGRDELHPAAQLRVQQLLQHRGHGVPQPGQLPALPPAALQPGVLRRPPAGPGGPAPQLHRVLHPGRHGAGPGPQPGPVSPRQPRSGAEDDHRAPASQPHAHPAPQQEPDLAPAGGLPHQLQPASALHRVSAEVPQWRGSAQVSTDARRRPAASEEQPRPLHPRPGPRLRAQLPARRAAAAELPAAAHQPDVPVQLAAAAGAEAARASAGPAAAWGPPRPAEGRLQAGRHGVSADRQPEGAGKETEGMF